MLGDKSPWQKQSCTINFEGGVGPCTAGQSEGKAHAKFLFLSCVLSFLSCSRPLNPSLSDLQVLSFTLDAYELEAFELGCFTGAAATHEWV